MKDLKERIISMLIVTAMIATGTVPRAFAEVAKKSSVQEFISAVSETDNQTTMKEYN